MRIGIDLGGTKIEGVLLDDQLSPIERKRIATPASDGYDAIVDAIVALAQELEAGADGECSVGIGTPGAISAVTGGMKNSNSICLNGRPLLQDLERKLERTVKMANDANCFALSEAVNGAASGARVVFGVILGTGVGGGIVLDGKAHAGLHGIAGEWGHNCLVPDGAVCYCGRKGCVEAYLCGAALGRHHEAAGGATGLTAREIAEAAAGGDSVAVAALDAYLDYFGRALAVVLNILDPDAVVLGGGLSNIERLYLDGPTAIQKYLFNDELRTKLVKNQHGDSSGVFGAAML